MAVKLTTKDIRVGNFVEGGTPLGVWIIEEEDYHAMLYDGVEFEGIPLTEEWLLKFGFRPFKNDFAKKGIVIHNRKRGFVLRKSVPDILYVHQLQNLYHALTGQELTA